MPRQLHVLDDRREWRSSGMRHGRAIKPWVKFLSDRRAANNVAAFQNQRLVTFLRQVERSHQRVMPAAQNNNVALRGHLQLLPESFRTSSAASRPGAPMIPPPGCVADPHMYSFFIG